MDYKGPNDHEIVYLAQEKNEDAETLLYKKYRPLVYDIAREFYRKFKRYGVPFEDLVQEGYVGFFRAVTYYDPDRSVLFYTYACLCVRSRIANAVKFYTTYKSTLLHTAYALDSYAPGGTHTYLEVMESPDPTPEAVVDVGELYTFLTKFKHRLSFHQSCIFELRYNGFTYAEISQLLDVNKRSVGTLLAKIRHQLKTELLDLDSSLL